MTVTELWVSQSFDWDNQCITNQVAGSDKYQLTLSGWINDSYGFVYGLHFYCPACANQAFATASADFYNPVFCAVVTGQPGATTFVMYDYVSDYGSPLGTTQYTWSATAFGGCSNALHSVVDLNTP